MICTVRSKIDVDMSDESPCYGIVDNPRQLGGLVRAHRKRRRLNLETVSAIGGFSTRFLSEFERGKKTAELGKVLAALAALGLEVAVKPRQATPPPEDRSLGGT